MHVILVYLMHYLFSAKVLKFSSYFKSHSRLVENPSKSRHHPARAVSGVNRACDWSSRLASIQGAWLSSGKKVTLEIIFPGAILLKFRSVALSGSVIDQSESRYICDQRIKIYLSPNFRKLTPCNKNSLKLAQK